MPTSSHLPGGALVVLDDRPGLSTVTLCLGVPLSSRHEHEDELGAAHLLEHVTMTASPGPGRPSVDDWVAQVGGRANAETSKEWVTCWVRVASTHATEAVARLVDAVVRPVIDDDDVRRETRVVAQELRAGAADAEHTATERFFATLFRDHPAGRSVAGRSPDGTFHPLGTATLRSWHARALGTHHPVAALVGDPGALAECATVLESSPLASVVATHGRPGSPPPSPAPADLTHVDPDESYAAVVVGGLGAGRDDPLRAAHQVLACLVGGLPGSALEHRLRRETGTSYYLESASTSMSDAGVWRVTATCPPGDVPTVVDAVRRCLSEVAAGRVTAERLDVARAQAAGGWQIDMEDPVALAHEYVYASVEVDGPADVLARTRRRLADVSAPDVAAAAERVLATFTAVAGT